MKKIAAIILLFSFALVLSACTFDFTTASTSATTTTYMTTGTTTPTTQTSTTQIDLDQIKQDVYNQIYEQLYDDIRAEVIATLSQERFDAIYQQVVGDLLDKIVAGEIVVDAQSIVDMIYQVAATSATAVVGVSTYDAEGGTLQAIGSGVIYHHVGDLYYVVTNNHVVEGGTYYEIVFEDGTSIPAVLRGVDTLVDVAVLYLTSSETYSVATFGDSDSLQKGTIVLAVGNPSGYDYYGSMTMGIVSGTNRYFDIDGDNTKDMFVGYIQHDASINAGNSGGALFNLQGEVIGINVIKIASVEIEGMGFAIPSNLVSDICADIEEYGVSKVKPMLGISFIDISEYRDYLIQNGISIPESITTGFYVSAVTTGASLDGYVLPGDIILQIGDITIVSTADFVTNFTKYRVGDVIDVVVYRNGQTITLPNIELKAKPEA